VKIDRGTYIILGFDMETDIGSWTPYYEGLEKGTPKLLELLETKKITATFFFTGDSAIRYPKICQTVKKMGHEIGCHSLSHETVGDPIFDIPGVFRLLPEEVEGRIGKSTEIIKNVIGQYPTSFRSPRLWGSTATINALEKFGYIADASYPMYFYEEQLIPYHPSRYNWLKKGQLNIIEIPNFADITLKSKDKYKRDRDQWPLFRTESAEELMVHVNNFINYVQNKNLPAVLCFYFHPWEFIEMPEKIHYGEGSVIPEKFIVKNCGDYALEQLTKLIDIFISDGVSFVTARDIASNFNW
jgi:peptidoglycan-N-acetylglucosamine deacetylase